MATGQPDTRCRDEVQSSGGQLGYIGCILSSDVMVNTGSPQMIAIFFGRRHGRRKIVKFRELMADRKALLLALALSIVPRRKQAPA